MVIQKQKEEKPKKKGGVKRKLRGGGIAKKELPGDKQDEPVNKGHKKFVKRKNIKKDAVRTYGY